MFQSAKRIAQKSVMTVSSWYRVPQLGVERFELLATSSCVPIKANPQYKNKYHFVCPFHVVAPYLFKSYFPESVFPWLKYVTEDNVIVTTEFRDTAGHITNRIGIHNQIIAHEWRDLCCLHLHKESEALISLKMYGMDEVKKTNDTVPIPSIPDSQSMKTAKEKPIEEQIEEMNVLIKQSTKRIPSDEELEKRNHVRVMKEAPSDPIHPTILHSLRKADQPYNQVTGVEIIEDVPQKGEPVLLSGFEKIERMNKDGRDASLMTPYQAEGRVLRVEDGRSMVMTQTPLPNGMLGGGMFDMYGNCRGMIEGVVQKAGSSVNGHVVKNTHPQNIYEGCVVVTDSDVLSDFIGNVELGLLDDMQEEVRKMKEQYGEDKIKEEQARIIKPVLDQMNKAQ